MGHAVSRPGEGQGVSELYLTELRIDSTTETWAVAT